MHGDSRHARSRPRRGNARNDGAARPERGPVPGPLPDEADLARVLEPAIRAAGMDLESVRISPAGRRRLLKVVVDADGGVGLDAIAEVSREISVRLDASGAMGEVPYTLEVSSPGVDRPLIEPRHWRRAEGRLVSAPLATAAGDDTARTKAPRRPPTISGRILVAGDTSVTLDIDGDRVELDYAELGPGRVQVEFARAGTSDDEDDPAGPGERPPRGADGARPAGQQATSRVLDRARAGNGGGQDGH